MTNTHEDLKALEDLKSLSAARRWAKNGTARKIRDLAELTQAEIAEACNVDPSTVALWEKGERTPTGEPAKTYARVLVGLGSSFPGGIVGVESRMTGISAPPAGTGRTEGFGIPLIEAQSEDAP